MSAAREPSLPAWLFSFVAPNGLDASRLSHLGPPLGFDPGYSCNHPQGCGRTSSSKSATGLQQAPVPCGGDVEPQGRGLVNRIKRDDDAYDGLREGLVV